MLPVLLTILVILSLGKLLILYKLFKASKREIDLAKLIESFIDIAGRQIKTLSKDVESIQRKQGK